MLDRTKSWPPDYDAALQWRWDAMMKMRKNPDVLSSAIEYYTDRPRSFIEDWLMTYDPRNAPLGKLVNIPFLMFPRQREYIKFIHMCLLNSSSGLVEKSRDMGATWLSVGYSVWLWRFVPGATIGWGSRKEELVDRIGVMDSIFEKVRWMILHMPVEFHPRGFSTKHLNFMKVSNPETNAAITGECGDNIGRGGRNLIYFKDESAHYEHPEAIEAALGDNTNVQIDISSVNGLGNVFQRRRENGLDWDGQTVRADRTNVFVFDWRDHPEKTMEWYRAREQKAKDDGLLHQFRSEVDRNYAASVEGTIIPADWLESCVDAHLKLGFTDEGPWTAALDVADEGGDRNALAKRKGVILKYVDDWADGDGGVTARRSIDECAKERQPIRVMYDSVGVGATVKAEVNRLERENHMPKYIQYIGWAGGGAVLEPDKRVIPGDDQTPINKDFYENLKAQAWWMMRRRVEKTHKAITEGVRYDPAELISIPSKLVKRALLMKELAQPTAMKSSKMKLMINKKPKGTKSPNLADSVVMAYWPIPNAKKYDNTYSWVE
jgi:phage terminase large subunit